MESWAMLGAPLYTVASYGGMGAGPGVLRKAKVGSAVGSPVDLGDAKVGPLSTDRAEGRTRNLSHFIESTRSIYELAKSVRQDRALVLGGECSVTVGSMAGLSEAFGGRPGMLWMDAHGDFNVPETSPSGYIGGMCLALACGRGPKLGLPFEARGSPLAEERLVHIGARDLDSPEIAAFNSSPAKLFTSQQVRKSGAAEVASEAARHLSNRSDWIACHLDVDVLDPSIMPAVNYPTPGGLELDDVAAVVRELSKTGKLRAFELTSYNAAKDAGRRSLETIVRLMKSSLS